VALGCLRMLLWCATFSATACNHPLYMSVCVGFQRSMFLVDLNCNVLLRPYIVNVAGPLNRAEKDRLGLNSDGVARSSTTVTGKRVVCGGPKLKSTQTYSVTFASSIASWHKRYTIKDHLKNKVRCKTYCTMPDLIQLTDEWVDARLDGVGRFVSRRMQKRS